MLREDFASLCACRGLHQSGSAAYGVATGFPVAASLSGSLLSLTFTLAGPLPPSFVKEARRTLRPQKLLVSSQGDLLTVSLKAKYGGTLQEKYDDAVQAVGELLRAEGIQPPQVCGICGGPDWDYRAFFRGGFRPAHYDCLAQSTGSSQMGKQKASGSYPLGILGGLLGGLVACIPSIFSILLVQTIYGLLYALIPMGVYFGYKKFGGPLHKGAVAIICVLSFLCAFFVDFGVVAVQFVEAVAGHVPFYYVVFLFADPAFVSEFFIGSLSSLVFILLGLWISWRTISQAAFGSTVHNVMATAVPVDPGARPMASAIPAQVSAEEEYIP